MQGYEYNRTCSRNVLLEFLQFLQKFKMTMHISLTKFKERLALHVCKIIIILINFNVFLLMLSTWHITQEQKSGCIIMRTDLPQQ